MARPPRLHSPGTIYHVMSRGNDGKDIFLDDLDRIFFLHTLRSAKSRLGFSLYAYCLMSNHFHALVEVTHVPLSRVMQYLLTCHAKRFNIRYERVGHLFQARFKAIVCPKDSYFLELLCYIHLNPVRAGLVRDPLAWEWSGHREYCGPAEGGLVDTHFPLSLFDADPTRARAQYAEFVRQGMGDEGPSLPPLPEPVAVEPPAADGSGPAVREAPAIKELAAIAAAETGVSVEAMRGPGRLARVAAARRLLVERSIAHGLRPYDIATFIRRSPSLISKLIRPIGLFR